MKNIQIETTLTKLYKDSRKDYLRMVKGAAKSIFRPISPYDFKEAYLSISKEQGEGLVSLIVEKNIKRVVEFGSSFGISTLFLAQGVLETGGSIITTELISSKAQKAIENFNSAGVSHIIDLREGDALETLKNHHLQIDLLLLDGWKDLYLPLFQMLESSYHKDTIIYVDNADMSESKEFLEIINQDSVYQLQYLHEGKVAIITIANKEQHYL